MVVAIPTVILVIEDRISIVIPLVLSQLFSKKSYSSYEEKNYFSYPSPCLHYFCNKALEEHCGWSELQKNLVVFLPLNLKQLFQYSKSVAELEFEV